MANLKITLVRGFANKTEVQKVNAKSLGLHKIGQSVIREDTPVYRGMINKIRHMVTVEEAD
ncbi:MULTISPECIES: 50S ribosomal protein L30 [Bifidobacterium]|uniref:Large ribosomal subunit protein uL30 n=1 Tax=Bifidobacterium tissieri TaxID=1630162 RepID=A0A261FI32_9BIFI|nr:MULTISPECIES: 50S ribosomal protein L30 [Bifidobacterium]KAA8831096.1 50S ribosomal protein L30 [Bifidobacterium tissieri]KAA8833249.1 50S ribosomal protein L30 [Bifidobacterium tissieri]OZG58820.1 50S ribosomal protein L30 [Bifidobacterium tissieri]TPF96613.1 50S ribosomal protein L30 [Bifidobacterium sp. UTCIF-39]